jgi:hypothetical protein
VRTTGKASRDGQPSRRVDATYVTSTDWALATTEAKAMQRTAVTSMVAVQTTLNPSTRLRVDSCPRVANVHGDKT